MVLLLFLIIVGIRVYAPKMLVKSIQSEPDQVISRIIPPEMKRPIIENTSKLPQMLDTLNISPEQAAKTIDDISTRDIMQILEKLNQSELASTRQVADIIFRQVELKSAEEEKIKQFFVNNVSLEQIKKGQELLNQNREALPLLIPVAKDTYKQILKNPELLDHYKKNYLDQMQ